MKTPALLIFGVLTVSLAASPVFAEQASQSPWAKEPSMPSTMYVRGGSGPIDQALATIIPAPYQIALDQSVPSSAVLVWPDGANWMDVLKSAVQPLGLKVRPDWGHNVIRIVRPERHARPVYAQSDESTAARTRAMPAGGRDSADRGRVRTMPMTPATAATSGASESAAHHTKAVSAIAPKAPKAVGYTIEAGTRLSKGLATYIKSRGWSLRWHIEEDYVLDAPFPIPPGSVEDGVRYVMEAYHSQGGLMGATVVFAKPNKIVLVKPAQAKESN